MSYIEIVLNIVEIVISFLAVIAVIFGWVIPCRQANKEELRRRESENKLEMRRWNKEFIDRQISELYGPLDEIVREQQITFDLILFQLGRKYVIPKDKEFKDFPEREQNIWKHYVNTYSIPNQKKIVNILRSKIHLIYNSEIPSCVYNFLDYALGMELLDDQKKNGVENYYQYCYSYNYSKQFDSYISETLKILLNRQSELTNNI